MILRGRLPPEQIFPAGRPDLTARRLELRSGLSVRVVEAGPRDAPSVVLIPGWACPAYIFRENIGPLAAAGLHVVVAELKGHGLSDKPTSPAEYGLVPMREHLLEILDALGLGSTFLGGLSMGAALAAHVAAVAPDRVRGLVLVSPVGFGGVAGLRMLRALTPASVTPVLPRLPTRGMVRALLGQTYGRRRRPTEQDVDEFWAPTQFPEFAIAMRHLLHRMDWRAPFPSLRAPVLMIRGSLDRLVAPGLFEICRRTTPQIQWLEIEGAGHVVLDEAPDVVNRALLDFLRAQLR